MKTMSEKLWNEWRILRQTAINSIATIMRSHNAATVSLEVDEDGNVSGDEDYDADWACDNRIWVDCYGKYSNENGYIQTVSLDEDGNVIFEAEGECDTYQNDYIGAGVSTYISVLERLEFMEKHNQI